MAHFGTKAKGAKGGARAVGKFFKFFSKKVLTNRYFYGIISSESEGKKMKEKRIPHIHCPVSGWDCPYYTDKGQPCLCTLENPIEDCDDFAAMWDKDDDYIDDDWIESEE